MGTWSKKGLVRLVLLCYILSGCKSDHKDPVTITVIHAWGGTESDHVAMRDIYESFQDENPDIKLQLISMPSKDKLLRKVEDMIMVGNTPDVVTFSGVGQNDTYDFMIKNDMVLDLMPYLVANSGFGDNILETNLKYWITEEKQLFTISDVLLLSGGYWYNEDILKAARINEMPKTWEEFLVMCEEIQMWAEKENREVKPLQPSAEGYLYFMDHMLLGNVEEADATVQNHRLVFRDNALTEPLNQMKKIYKYSTSESVEYSYRDETSLFNEGKLAIYVNGTWGAPMISKEINAKYALLPTESGISMSCESACLGYVLGKSGNEQTEEVAVRFLKYMLSEKVQRRILEETEQIPINPKISLSQFKEEKPRLYQAALLVLNAEQKTEVPDNLWTVKQKSYFTENLLQVLTEEMTVQEFEHKLK